MLKILYLLVFSMLLAFLLIASTNAQVEDNFDSYTAGQQLACQSSGAWTTWSNAPCNTTEDPLVSNTFSLSPPNSVVITPNNDAIKLLGEQTSGTWYLSLNTYIPTGKHGYFSILSSFPSSAYWGLELVFSLINPGQVRLFANHTETNFPFQYSTWNFTQVVINLDTDLAEFWFNGNLVLSWPWTQGSTSGTGPLAIDALEFWGPTANDGMYVDNIWFHSSPVPVELTSFTASVNSLGQTVLNWVTATEINNRGFEVERKVVDGQFITIGFVEGYGTTSEEQIYSYVDRSVIPGTFVYRLKQIDFDGQFEYSDEVQLDVTGPLEFALEQNYPNPFNPETKIKYNIANTGLVKLSVYNIIGEEVQVLVNEIKEAGLHEINFDASSLPSGTYLYKINAPQFTETRKMLLIK